MGGRERRLCYTSPPHIRDLLRNDYPTHITVSTPSAVDSATPQLRFGMQSEPVNLEQTEEWDDYAIQSSWNAAVAEYEVS